MNQPIDRRQGDPPHDPAGDDGLAALQRDLAAAHAEIALVGQQMAAEVAARHAAQEEAARQLAVAAEAHTKRRAALEAEVDQLRERLDDIAPLPDAVPTGRWGRLRRFAARPAARRTKFGSIAAAIVLGLALGAAGVAWWNPASAPMPMESQVAQPPGERASGPAAEVPASVAAPPTSPMIGAASLESRIQASLAQQGLSLPVRVGDGLADVSLGDEGLDAGQRAKTVVIVRSVFAGAGLPDPGIEHAALSRETAPPESQPSPAAAVTRPGHPQAGLASDASSPVGDGRNPEDGRPVPAARSAGGHARADAALSRTVPQATPTPEPAANATNVSAGAGLPDPGIEQATPSRETAPPEPQRPPAAAVTTRPDNLQAGAGNDAPSPVDDRRNPEDERPVPAARSAGGHARADAATPGRVVPQAASRPEPARNANASKGLEASCQQQLTEPLWDPRRPWRLASCMKQACCRQGVLRNEECRAFNQRYPLNCS